ncbi:hypothetical protein MMC13_002827 [Lambiella insularis]|nr:hypothetical protein [Lambiella insularis]
MFAATLSTAKFGHLKAAKSQINTETSTNTDIPTNTGSTLFYLPAEGLLQIVQSLPASAVLNLGQCSKFFHYFREVHQDMIISNILYNSKDEVNLPRVIFRAALGLYTKEELLKIAVATQLIKSPGNRSPGTIDPIIVKRKADGDTNDCLYSTRIHREKTDDMPLHTEEYLPYVSPWKEAQNVRRLNENLEAVSKWQWEYLTFLVHINTKIRGAADQLSLAFVPDCFLDGKDKSRWLLLGCYFEWARDLCLYGDSNNAICCRDLSDDVLNAWHYPNRYPGTYDLRDRGLRNRFRMFQCVVTIFSRFMSRIDL